MPSGRRERVMIACVTFEVAKIVEPVEFYEATKVHLLNRSSENTIYREFLDQVVKDINERMPRTEVIIHDCKVFDFSEVMKEVLCIIQDETDKHGEHADIYVNISAGTSEYSAASLMASMMHTDVTIPFTVSAKEFQVPEERIREIYYDGDRPVGMTKTTREPKAVSAYPIEKPDRTKVLALKVMKEQIEKGDSCAATMMSVLNEKGLFDNYKKGYNGKPEQKEVMKYQRNYVDFWLSNGWLEKVSKRKSRITPTGNEILEIFSESYCRD